MPSDRGAVKRASPLPWAMVPTNFWALPVVQIAGHDAAVMVLTLLIDAGQWGADMSLPPECLDPRRLASATGLAERDGRKAAAAAVESALVEAFDAGLLVREDGRVWFGPGLWIRRDDVRRKLAADEKKRRRVRNSSDGASKVSAQCTDKVRTPGGDGPHTVQQREERENTPLPPTGGSAADEPATLHEQAAAVQAVAAELDRDEHAGKAEAGQRLMRAIHARGGVLRRRQSGDLAELVGAQPTAVVDALTARIEAQSGRIGSPLGYIRSMLDDVRAQVDERQRADRARAKAAQEVDRLTAERRRVVEFIDTPEQRQKAAAQWGRLDGGAV